MGAPMGGFFDGADVYLQHLPLLLLHPEFLLKLLPFPLSQYP